MKANELRIGNWFTIGDSNPFQLTGIFHEYVWALIDETDFPVKDLTPIPLTEEWLFMFGFNERHVFENISNWESPNYKFVVQTDSSVFAMANATNSIMEDIDLKYVHQLQNLYFALTGEELEIKKGAD